MAGIQPERLARNNANSLVEILVGLYRRTIDRNSRGYSYCRARGEILGLRHDERLRKHLPRMFSLIKNESLGIEDD